MAQMEEDVASINAARPLLARIRREIELPSEGAPPACRGDLRERIAEVVRQGGFVQSNMGSIRDDMDRLCSGFDRWENPDEQLESRIAGFAERLGRIDGWMREILQCINPGPYNFRCENAYGAQEPGDEEQARAALRVVAEVRAEVQRAPRFPCYSEIWRRVEATTWTMSVARAQVPGIARNAHSLCESIGVDASSLAERVGRIRDRVDRSSAQLVQLGASRQEALLRMRAVYE